MPVITDNPPQNVQNDLNSLSAALDAQIPGQANDNLLIASWNIRSFSSLTQEWTACEFLSRPYLLSEPRNLSDYVPKNVQNFLFRRFLISIRVDLKLNS